MDDDASFFSLRHDTHPDSPGLKNEPEPYCVWNRVSICDRLGSRARDVFVLKRNQNFDGKEERFHHGENDCITS